MWPKLKILETARARVTPAIPGWKLQRPRTQNPRDPTKKKKISNQANTPPLLPPRLVRTNGALPSPLLVPAPRPSPLPRLRGQEGAAAARLRLSLLRRRLPGGDPAVVHLPPRRHRRYVLDDFLLLDCFRIQVARSRVPIFSWCFAAQRWGLAWPEGKPTRCLPVGEL